MALFGVVKIAEPLQPSIIEGQDPITERNLRFIVVRVNWKCQKGMWTF